MYTLANRMHNLSCLIILSVLIFAQGFHFQSEDEDKFTPIRDRKHDVFDWQLFKAFSSENIGKNVIISPLSVKFLLAVVSEAAISETRTQLSALFPDLQQGPPVHEYCKKVLNSLEKRKTEYELYTGGKLFMDKRFTPAPKFIEIASTKYNTSTESADFLKADDVTQIINNWAANITKGHISDIINREQIQEAFGVLVNAIYFKGTWVNIFHELLTMPTDFTVSPSESVIVPMMSQIGKFWFLDSNTINAKLLRMPYKGGKYAMTFILPHDPNGIENLIKNIKLGQIQRLQGQLQKKDVHVFIPKFKFEITSHLRNSTESLGITEIFSVNAQLPGFGMKKSHISDVIQRAGIVVDEKGTEAYAVAKATILNKSPGGEMFDAKHPFMFFVEDELTGALLFAGKVVNPTIEN